ncbi:multidrug effflux MFS transporter [Agitococcus lubricus]|uniref:Bcr/CflA family efflux transporter n=1 Tax=Agitococcus lubricus TaxID=1077255 RepID=A0A2T5J2J1_9GAMM|nr:multidrug effflux MFS transporter [Agitococcus lubricus]PTQ90739.1 DHA1 family bicyclomycin/chloramphenicol resistance-like MFS transporter [Agitococcus lubricus]
MSSQTRLKFEPWLILLGALTAIGPLSIDMYLPSFPTLEQELGQGAQLSLASFFIGMAIGQVLYGSLSDRFGRKAPLIIGLSIFMVSALAASQAHNMHELIIYRFLQGFGGCSGMVIARAIVRDRCQPSQAAQAFSMLILVMGLAPILAPMAGSYFLTAWGWHSIFYFKAGFALVCLTAILILIPESHKGPFASLALRKVFNSYWHLLRDKTFIGYTLSSGLAFSGMFAYIAGSPHVFIELQGLSPQQYSLMFGTNAFGFIAASQLNAWLLRQEYNMLRILHLALWIPATVSTLLCLAALMGFDGLWLLLFGFFSYIVSLGFISPNAGAAAMAHQGHQAGTASALMGVLQFGLASTIGVLLGLFHSDSALPLLSILMVCGVGAFVWHRLVVVQHPT